MKKVDFTFFKFKNQPLKVKNCVTTVFVQVSFITLDDDGQETGKEAEVVNSPPSDNPHQWVDGLFDLKADDGTIYKGYATVLLTLLKVNILAFRGRRSS